METERIAIFPLAQVVLFPRVNVPLHLFEPRYRQLAADVLAGDSRIGMVTVPGEHTGELPGDPPVYPVGCMGHVTRHRRRPDGRYDILLSGQRRFRIASEPARPDGQLYRVAEVTWLEDPLPEASDPDVPELRSAVEEHYRQLVARIAPERRDAARDEELLASDHERFANVLCTALDFAPAEKQRLLEVDAVGERLALLEGLLAFRLAALGQPGSDPERLH